jgi:hypothetical protein
MKHKLKILKDPLQRTIAIYQKMVKDALNDPTIAAKLAHDDDMPVWLQKLAAELCVDRIIPALYQVLEDCSENPHIAKRWYHAALRGRMPDWFQSYAELMAKRRKWIL